MQHNSGQQPVFKVIELRTVEVRGDNIHAIYELTSTDALAVARQLDSATVDAIVFTGTGMPSLGAIQALQAESELPILSSNLCLLSALARELGLLQSVLLDVPATLDVSTL